MGKSILHRLFVILAGSKYCFTPEITSCSLRTTNPLLNNWFKVQPINQNHSRANEKVGPLVQDLDSVLKGTTYLLSQKWVGVNSIYVPSYPRIYGVITKSDYFVVPVLCKPFMKLPVQIWFNITGGPRFNFVRRYRGIRRLQRRRRDVVGRRKDENLRLFRGHRESKNWRIKWSSIVRENRRETESLRGNLRFENRRENREGDSD
uniref:Uncharacterized protein n=1 Tax=Cucumis melo TaxID=3656 RepID=A0A9I9E5W8_CUCME